MKRSIARKSAFAVAAGLFCVTALTQTPANAAEDRSYILATATTGGTYYPVGVALATLTKVKLEPKQKIAMSAITSAGSGENVKLLRENQAQFAILQGLYGAWARKGSGEVSEPLDIGCSVTMLWQNVEHFTVKSSFAKSGNVDDLKGMKGEKFSIGKRNSGTEGSGRTILSGLGIDADSHFEIVYQGYGPSADSLQNGTISGMNIPAGPPVGAITRAAAALKDEMRVLDFTDAQIEAVNNEAGLELWTRFVIKADTYPGQSKDINTIAQPNFLATRCDVDEDAVYQITKTIYENLGFLQNIHKATNAMSLDSALKGLPLPLHAGAAKYFKEQGLTIPASLVK